MSDMSNAKSMSIIVTKGTLDWAYPPFILSTTAAAMDMKVSMFFTFYGLPLLLKNLDSGVDRAATTMMKNLVDKKGVASIDELREAAVDLDVQMIGCQMTLDLFEYSPDDMIEGIELGGAATYLEVANNSDINLFI